MKKATVTYTAPAGENKVLEIMGTTLLTGKPDTVICDDVTMARLVNGAKGSASLKVENVTDYTEPKAAAPKAADEAPAPKKK